MDPSDVKERLREWRQGDVVRPAPFNFVADGENPGTPVSVQDVSERPGDGWRTVETSVAGIVAISQTCDIVAKDPAEAPFVVFAVLVELTGDIRREASGGDRPRFVAVPQLGETWFADLDQTLSVEKSALVGVEHTPGVSGTSEERVFGEAVGRKFSRFAFPDDVVDSLKSLRDRIKDRHKKDASPEGMLLQGVEEVRLRGIPDWHAQGTLELEVTLILGAGALFRPGANEPPVEPSSETKEWFQAAARGASNIAERIQRTSIAADVSWLWDRLGDAWAELCMPVGQVSQVTVEIVCADEMTVSQYWGTESADLDYLSSRDGDSPG